MAKRQPKTAEQHIEDAKASLLAAYNILKGLAVERDQFDTAKDLKRDYDTATKAADGFASHLD